MCVFEAILYHKQNSMPGGGGERGWGGEGVTMKLTFGSFAGLRQFNANKSEILI